MSTLVLVSILGTALPFAAASLVFVAAAAAAACVILVRAVWVFFTPVAVPWIVAVEAVAGWCRRSLAEGVVVEALLERAGSGPGQGVNGDRGRDRRGGGGRGHAYGGLRGKL